MVRISESFLSSTLHFYLFIQTIFLSSLLSPLCWWWCFLFCSPKMKKTKRRLTVDPIDFQLGCDYVIESRGRKNQVEAGPPSQNQLFPKPKLICMPSYQGPAVCFFFSLFLFSLFAKPGLVWQDNITFVSSTVIIHSPNVYARVCTDTKRLKWHETKSQWLNHLEIMGK